ncbi:MAG: YdbL family protein [Pseudomonadota bacterium]|nr:YdbL family protein [Pseudomonadota bacterium]
MARSVSFLQRSALAAVALAIIGLAGGAFAQGRDPAYAAARSAGQVGELMNGYLGVTGAGTAEVRRMVDDINIRRKAVYAEKAQVQHATVEEYAFTSGCVLILHTEAGEKYQAPNGSWQTRSAQPPARDPRCP